MNFKTRTTVLLSALVLLSASFVGCTKSDGKASTSTTKSSTSKKSKVTFGKENDYKYAESATTLEPSDFEGTDFFIKNIPNDYFDDFNVEIFDIIRGIKAEGEFEPYGEDNEEIEDFKEWIIFTNDGGISYTQEDITKDGQRGSLHYDFLFEFDEEAYEQLKEGLKTMDTLEDEDEQEALLDKLSDIFPYDISPL